MILHLQTLALVHVNFFTLSWDIYSPPLSALVSYQQRVRRQFEITEENKNTMAGVDPEALSKAFVSHYYSTFDQNRAGLANLYQEASMLTFEGDRFQGPHQITAKLTGLPFQQCQHHISTVDCQQSGPAGGMLVFVSGNLQIVGEQHPLKFSQMFHLMPTPQGSYYVLNDIFRLNYA